VPVTTEEIATYVLPWAKVHRVDAYGKTLAVAQKPEVFRSYVLRLLELRWQIDPEFKETAPFMLLEETGISQKYRHRPTGTEIVVSGKKVEGRVWGWMELEQHIREGRTFDSVASVKAALDLEVTPS
jgi:hypothetical protein